MSDLISRQALTKYLQSQLDMITKFPVPTSLKAIAIAKISECINYVTDYECAYDVDKVVSAIKIHIEAWEDKSFLRRDIAEEHIKALTWVLGVVTNEADLVSKVMAYEIKEDAKFINGNCKLRLEENTWEH